MATRLTLDRAAHPCISQAPLTLTSSRRLLIDCSLFTFQIRSLETELSASPEEETHQRQTSPLGKSYLHSRARLPLLQALRFRSPLLPPPQNTHSLTPFPPLRARLLNSRHFEHSAQLSCCPYRSYKPASEFDVAAMSSNAERNIAFVFCKLSCGLFCAWNEDIKRIYMEAYIYTAQKFLWDIICLVEKVC